MGAGASRGGGHAATPRLDGDLDHLPDHPILTGDGDDGNDEGIDEEASLVLNASVQRSAEQSTVASVEQRTKSAAAANGQGPSGPSGPSSSGRDAGRSSEIVVSSDTGKTSAAIDHGTGRKSGTQSGEKEGRRTHFREGADLAREYHDERALAAKAAADTAVYPPELTEEETKAIESENLQTFRIHAVR